MISVAPEQLVEGPVANAPPASAIGGCKLIPEQLALDDDHGVPFCLRFVEFTIFNIYYGGARAGA